MNYVPIIYISSGILVFIASCILLWKSLRTKTDGPIYRKKYHLLRHAHNPIASPQSHREWEYEGTFNPGAVMDDEGRVHLFYRALGRDGISRVGHMLVPDGKTVTERSSYPVYEPRKGAGMPDEIRKDLPIEKEVFDNPSGGGWGGAEDPRMVRIGNRVFMSYTAFEDWSNMRIAITSISMNDLKKKRWNWKQPLLISPKNSRAKNWVLFPEKIRGKYAILHGLSPRIMVAYLDSPDMIPSIESLRDHGGWGYQDKKRKGYWDECVRGAGAPPMKTDLGWLLLYHAIDKRDPARVVGYKVGAMILDLEDPTRVIYRSPEPILSPDMHYENDGKPGVVYASGAVLKDGTLFVYYGGGDKHTCVAETPLAPLLEWLQNYGRVE